MLRMQQVPGTLDVMGRTQMVIDHHLDESRPGKPLQLLIPGGLVALGAVGLALYLGYLVWIAKTLHVSTAESLLAVVGVIFIAATFAFSYGYELYNVGKAIRLTLILVVLAPFAVLMIPVVVLAIFGRFNAETRNPRRYHSAPGAIHKYSHPLVEPLLTGIATGRIDYGEGTVVTGGPDADDDASDADDDASGAGRAPAGSVGQSGFYSDAVYTPPPSPAAPTTSWLPAGTSNSPSPAPLPAPIPLSWSPTAPAPSPEPVAAVSTAPPAAAAVVQPPVALAPIVCHTCTLSFVPIAGEPPICPNCGAQFVTPPTG